MSSYEKKGLQEEEYSSVVSDVQFQGTAFQKFVHSFKRQHVTVPPDVDLDSMDLQTKRNFLLSIQPVKENALNTRHIQFIAIGSTIGTGLFIGLGYALAEGPGAALIGFSIVGIGIYAVVQAGAEMVVAYPISGSFASHVSRFLDPAIGFTVSTNYALSWLISFASEIIGASMTIQYWSSIAPVAWVGPIWVFIMGLNLLGVRAYGESEFILSIVKVAAVFIFVIIGIVIICGGGPDSTGYIGAKYWHDPGAFVKPVLKSICSTLISAGFSFGGTELCILSVEANGKAIQRATKLVFWRILLFYVVTIVVIGCLVPYSDPRLLGGSSDEDVTASPFVIALANTGQFGVRVANFMNAVILTAVLSVCNSSVFASSRVIQSLGATGQLPQIFGYIDNAGRPLAGIAIAGVFGLLCFLVASANQDTVFDWLFALCSISSFFTWFCICVSHIRMRLALRKQGRSTAELPHKATLGIYGSILGAIIHFLIIVGEIWISAWPLGEESTASGFFMNCLSIPLMIVVFIIYRFYYGLQWKKPWISLSEIDLDTGRRFPDIDILKQTQEEEKQIQRAKPIWYKAYRWFC
ncbi:hypothetical protein WICMUC_000616 [Wickerhamomyces mucosus]|uniref:Amino acid permease/ SLC12A domain-containing protein n=1 Tax=Wickerhamomyces mucosus TaxID=1378264 RepID=A0A9P8PWS5_9ASCO|nr:hypothetical protein WICMUC_000616 [Wickerhamomyces mucosus]